MGVLRRRPGTATDRSGVIRVRYDIEQIRAGGRAAALPTGSGHVVAVRPDRFGNATPSISSWTARRST
jgi:hypothetical protein